MAVAAARAAKDARKRAKQRCADERKALLGSIFQKYDDAKDGLMTKDQVGLAIFEKTGELPSTEELDFVFLVADQQPKDGKLNQQEFSEAVIAYECYLEDFRNPDNDFAKLFDELDTDNSGGLNKEQLRNLLEWYSSEGQAQSPIMERSAQDRAKVGLGHVVPEDVHPPAVRDGAGSLAADIGIAAGRAEKKQSLHLVVRLP
mmetsp:Transcript_112256/g.302938  ORF Transcript_112256/g.302938 Transcript_112256/m.302938 type:complete len:202 (+) Transcript_112256:108-713(+)